MNKKFYQVTIIVLVLIIIFQVFMKSGSTSASSTTVALTRKDLYASPVYTPASYKIVEYYTDSVNGDVSQTGNITLDAAVAQMPSNAVGFVFAPLTLPVTSTSKGNVYYKSILGVTQDPSWATFQKVNGVWKYDTFNHSGNDLAIEQDGTIQDAIKYCDGLTTAKGFVFRTTDPSKPLSLTTPGHFYIKDNVGSWYETDRRALILYAKQSYSPVLANFSKSLV